MNPKAVGIGNDLTRPHMNGTTPIDQGFAPDQVARMLKELSEV